MGFRFKFENEPQNGTRAPCRAGATCTRHVFLQRKKPYTDHRNVPNVNINARAQIKSANDCTRGRAVSTVSAMVSAQASLACSLAPASHTPPQKMLPSTNSRGASATGGFSCAALGGSAPAARTPSGATSGDAP